MSYHQTLFQSTSKDSCVDGVGIGAQCSSSNNYYKFILLGGDNTANLNTLASDSSPFRDKYDMDEDGDIIGEVSYSYHPTESNQLVDLIIIQTLLLY